MIDTITDSGLENSTSTNENSELKRRATQHELSETFVETVYGALKESFLQGMTVAAPRADIGSFGRGTTRSLPPDIDPMFAAIPREGDFVDWSKITLTDKIGKEKVETLDELRQLDPRLADGIVHVLDVIHEDMHATEAYFEQATRWPDFDGVVVTISVVLPEHGKLSLDLNFFHKENYFGIEHARRFNAYIDHLEGSDAKAANDLIATIIDIKQLVKDAANGNADKLKKVPGFAIESLLMSTSAPLTFEQFMQNVRTHTGEALPTQDRIQSSDAQYIHDFDGTEDGESFQKTLEALFTAGAITKGGWENLRTLAQKYSFNEGGLRT